ncbi:MAG: hypothetical protein AB9869_01005 [Verrucomicrobiia bacterium]
MSKYGTFGEYPVDSLASAEKVLLTAWSALERFHGDLVLVGGLAVHLLTKPTAGDLIRSVTMDVDFGIALAASDEHYGTIKMDLAGLGFKSEGNRLVRQHGNLNIYIDFLTEDPPAISGSRMVDDVVASVIPGINRALTCRRSVLVEGKDIFGAPQRCQVWVADIGPLIVLKLNAFGGPTGRKQPKDAYDVLLAVTRFVDGPRAAVEGFQAEAKAKNTGFGFAVKSLQTYFTDPGQDGPIRAAEFHPSGAVERDRIRQDVTTVGRLLLGMD